MSGALSDEGVGVRCYKEGVWMTMVLLDEFMSPGFPDRFN